MNGLVGKQNYVLKRRLKSKYKEEGFGEPLPFHNSSSCIIHPLFGAPCWSGYSSEMMEY